MQIRIYSAQIVILLRFCLHSDAISPQKEARRRDYPLLLFRMTSRVIYSTQHHRQHSTLHAFVTVWSILYAQPR